MNPGVLNERAQILSLQTTAGKMRWEVHKNTWAKVEKTGKTNYFSKVGIGVRTIKFTLRRQPLSLHDALLFRGRHCFITNIIPISSLYIEVETAQIEPVPCILYDNEIRLDERNRPVSVQKPALCFPGLLVEKYMGYTVEKGHAESTVSYVLVTPKMVKMDEGKLVEIEKTAYKAAVCHELDEYKNEYEIVGVKDH